VHAAWQAFQSIIESEVMSTPIQDLFQLGGKVALITGGSRGLGLQIAEALGEAQARLIITSRKTADLEAAAAKLQEKGITAEWIAGDASGLLDKWGVETVASHAPLQQLGNDDDLKDAALLFASAAGKHITGQILAVDGGVSCVVGG
jgi:NAD(P)-dependent dehydrogenase (short-subunit alcohol dehydrogenase family)